MMNKGIAILVIGLGSMGKRRIRNLKVLGFEHIYGFDVREDRCDEARKLYNIVASTIIGDMKFDAWIISVPPDKHDIYMKEAVRRQIPAFIEASVVNDNLTEIMNAAKEKKLLLAPSCTLFFHPAIQQINNFIRIGELGKLSNILYHSGQYLPDWHTYEKVSEYYVSNKATGGAREIVPFELTWITKVIGYPQRIAGLYKKTITIEGAANIEDTYNILMDYGSFMMTLSVDVVSRHATRRLLINGEKKQLRWDWDENMIRIFDPVLNEWMDYPYESVSAQEGYNRNITEQMYVDEMQAFFSAAFGQTVFPNTMEDDIRVLEILYASEASCNNNIIHELK